MSDKDQPAGRRAVVRYEPVRCSCPNCTTDNPPVVRTMPVRSGGRLRYHRCAACGLRFLSYQRGRAAGE